MNKSWFTEVIKIELKRCIQENWMFLLSVTCRCTWTDSSDDDKIVKYLWEEMSGPLQDHTLQDDRNMLTLKDLVPGNYIFKWVHPIYTDRLIAGLQSCTEKLNVELCWKTDCRVIWKIDQRVVLINLLQSITDCKIIIFSKSINFQVKGESSLGKCVLRVHHVFGK